MKANELMIGDWVIDTRINCERKPTQITGEFFVRIKADGAYARSVIECDPIPLTPEILEKNGFVYNAIPFVDGWEQFGLTLYRVGNGYRIDCGINVSLIIDYVHHLQHILRLCGIEKEIKL